jgi:hypothetical protein
VQIPSLLTTIEDHMFYRCGQLQTVKAVSLSSVESIGKKAFAGCRCLTWVCLPIGLQRIADDAFCQSHSVRVLVVEDDSVAQANICTALSTVEATPAAINPQVWVCLIERHFSNF